MNKPFLYLNNLIKFSIPENMEGEFMALIFFLENFSIVQKPYLFNIQ